MISKAMNINGQNSKRCDDEQPGPSNEIDIVNSQNDKDEIDPPSRSNSEENIAPEYDHSDDSTDSTDNLTARTCYEEMPSSDGDSATKVIDADERIPDAEHINQQLSFPELLEFHQNQACQNIFSGFEFGEATKRRVEQNKKACNNHKNNEGGSDRSDENPSESVDQADGSKTVSEKDHKTPHSYKRQRLGESKEDLVNSDELNVKMTRLVPKALQNQPDCMEVWNFMVNKEDAMLKFRNPRIFYDFKMVTPRMRAILLDWLMEVSDVYHLRRVTYYLSVDYFDRFLSIRTDIPKSLLQLVGITCLYIAAKVEEIYPPNLKELAYVCDGACQAKDMVACEILILNSLGWEVVLTTPSDWLNLYMQLHHKSNELVMSKLSSDFNHDFVYPQYSAYQFIRASQLMDLLSLDPGFLKFNYSLIAATSMYFMYGKTVALQVSGFTWEQMEPCVNYMTVFYKIVKAPPDPRLHSCLGESFPGDSPKTLIVHIPGCSKSSHRNENYSFQTHVANIEYFEQAAIYRLSQITGKIPQDDESSVTPLEEVQHQNPDDEIDSLIDDIKSSGTQSDDPDKTHYQGLDEIFEMIFSHEDTPLPSNVDS